MKGKEKHRRPVVIKKVKKGGHGGHHGGSWKVAYADFVTAMMAFFMVMWIVGMEQNLKEQIEGYFSNPVGFKKGYSAGANILSSGNSPAQVKKPPIRAIVRASEERAFTSAERRLETALSAARRRIPNVDVEVSVTEQGLRIELMEQSDADPFFPSGSSTMRAPLVLALQVVAGELVELSNPLVLEGHTDASPFRDGDRTNWELSADRANAARRVLEASGIPAARIAEVRGYADTKPRIPGDRDAPQNRRISVLLPFTNIPEPAAPAAAPPGPPGAAPKVS